jgi:hypothetical protein
MATRQNPQEFVICIVRLLMLRNLLLTNIFTLSLLAVYGQEASSKSKSIDLGLAVGSSQGTFTAAYIHNRRFGKKQKFEVGIGGRLTTYFGSNQYYSTAPAEITTGGSGPGVLFKETIVSNIDTFLMASPQIFALNAMVNLGYRLSDKFSIGFSIDAIGFTLGSEKKGNYINGSFGQNTTGKPASFNALLIGDNDKGSLNSEFYAKYKLNEKWSLKAGFQYLFTEYVTATAVQQFPGPNDRFRNKSTLFTIGASLTLK